MARSAKNGWWDGGVAPPTWFTDVLVLPEWNDGQPVYTGESTDGEVYDTLPPSDPERDARALTEALNRLHAEVWARPGELELRGTISLKTPTQDSFPLPGDVKKYVGEGDAQALTSPLTSSQRTKNVPPQRINERL